MNETLFFFFNSSSVYEEKKEIKWWLRMLGVLTVGCNKLCLIIFVSIVHSRIKCCIWQWQKIGVALAVVVGQKYSVERAQK